VTGTCSSMGATCYYETVNTPAASYTATNRFYVSMNAYHNFGGYAGVDGYGMLVAFEVNASTISTPWSGVGYQFNGPSGASPVVLPVSGGSNSAIFFDGYGTMDPLLYKITDTGTSYTANWVSTTGDFTARIPASVTVDSANNCVWAYALGSTTLRCVDVTSATYQTDYTINTSGLSSGFPASDMTMTTISGGHVLILGMQLIGTNPGNILAINVTSGSNFGAEYWLFSLTGDAEFAPTQFPVITDSSGHQDIAFPSNQSRAYLYGN
jgi:hypothetical protein